LPPQNPHFTGFYGGDYFLRNLFSDIQRLKVYYENVEEIAN